MSRVAVLTVKRKSQKKYETFLVNKFVNFWNGQPKLVRREGRGDNLDTSIDVRAISEQPSEFNSAETGTDTCVGA